MPNSAIERLIKYIDLEASRGYDNRAVMGGLERAVEPWANDAVQSGVDEETVARVADALKRYPASPCRSQGEPG
jgi:ATP-dependent DNA helicase RecG